MLLKITIYGANCVKCNKLTEAFQKVVAGYHLNAQVDKITDSGQMVKAKIYSLPAVKINGQLVAKGVDLSENQIINLLNNFLQDNEKIPVSSNGKKINKSLVTVIAVLLIGLTSVILWYFLSVREAAPEKIKATVPLKMSLDDSLDLLYNYKKNKSAFSSTFLAFGTTGCLPCKKMEKVMQDARKKYSGQVNVVFYNVRNKENKKIAEHFGILEIPVQVLLDYDGKEFFRHVGYFSLWELSAEFKKQGIF
jgi:thiol-disulfide isomerase/thioredoxin